MVLQIALTSKSELTRVMSPHFSTVTVAIYFATSVLHSTHMMQEDVRLLFTSLSRALWRTVYALACLRACAYMCRFVNCRCVWVAFCVEWASLFFFQGHSCNGMRQMCTPLPVCFCVFVWDVWYAVADAIVFMCDSHIVSEEEVSLKCCNVPDRNADWSVNSSSSHSECVFRISCFFGLQFHSWRWGDFTEEKQIRF